jgi:hypothetical protein
MKERLLLFVLLVVASRVCGQEYVYVNTDNLLLRDRPQHDYRVYAVLHAPTKLMVKRDGEYKNDKAVNARFYYVYLHYMEDGFSKSIWGYVEKRYVVANPEKVSVRNIDKQQELNFDWVVIKPYMGDIKYSPNKFNGDKFPPPKYKGGDVFTKAETEVAKRKYHEGPRGGCYYIGRKGEKIYVDKQWCGDR